MSGGLAVICLVGYLNMVYTRSHEMIWMLRMLASGQALPTQQ